MPLFPMSPSLDQLPLAPHPRPRRQVVPAIARRVAAFAFSLAALTGALPTAIGAVDPGGPPSAVEQAAADELVGHLVLSELATGGAGASDEFVELYNPSTTALPLEGLELIYVTASGATVTRKAGWEAGAPAVAPGAHLLVANEAGIYAGIADATYANGLSATGGSLALRIIGASSAVDAVGWGTAASSWLEGSPAAAPVAGHSLERRPGGPQGSGQDTDDNVADFVERDIPDPQNSASPPIVIGDGSPTPAPTPSATAPASPTPISTPTVMPTTTPVVTVTPTPTPASTPQPTATPADPVITVAQARAMADDTRVTVEAVAITDHDFADGGGFVADSSGGIAVLVTEGSYRRGDTVRVTGTLDDRFAQRTIRAEGADIVPLGPGAEPPPTTMTTAAIAEAAEGRLVRIQGRVDGGPTALASGLAFDIDDGSGAARILVNAVTGIDTSLWVADAIVELVGIVGQRDSTGTGTAGYRVMPRDPADVLAVTGPSAPSASPGSSQAPSATPAPPSEAVVSVAQARAAATNATVRVRGVVTMATGLLDPPSAALQDTSGAIALRVGEEAGTLTLGELVEVEGKRSTFAGMLTIRVSTPPLRLGRQDPPQAAQRATGDVGEADEARLLLVRGAIGSSIQRSSAGNTYFDLDDGSGPLRVYLSPRAGIATGDLVSGAWVEVQGVLFQETSGQQPERGYRLWPRGPADLRVTAAPVASGSDTSTAPFGPSASSGVGPSAGSAPGSPDANGAVTGRPSRLTVARPSVPPPAGLVQPTAPDAQATDTQPLLAAGLLLVAAGGFAGGGGLLLGPAGLARLREAALRRLRGDAGDDEPSDPQAAPPELPTMVPLAVDSASAADGGEQPPRLSVVDGGARTREHGRILPPT